MIGTHASTQRVPSGSLRSTLQLATADIHEAMHCHPGFTRLMSGGMTLPEYSALLSTLYGFYFPLEQTLRKDFVSSLACTRFS